MIHLRKYLVCALLILHGFAAHATPSFEIEAIETPDGYESIRLNDISDSGYVAGTVFANDPEEFNHRIHRAVLWHDGGLTFLPNLEGYRSSDGLEVNESGQVIARSFLINETEDGSRATLLTESSVVDLGPSHDAGRVAYEMGINDKGDVVVNASPADYAIVDSVLYENLNHLNAINNNGVALGHDSVGVFQWTASGGKTYFSNVATDGSVSGHEINDNGHFVGNRFDTATFGYIYRNGAYQELGQFGHPATRPNDINIHDWVVGTGAGTAFFDDIAFLWTPNDGLMDLSTLLPEDSGWDYLEHAYGINDKGEIVGQGSYNGERFTGFILRPVPEPTTALLLAAPLLVLARRTRRIG